MGYATLLNTDQILLPPVSGIQRFNLYYSAPSYNAPAITTRLPQSLLAAAADGIIVVDRITMAHTGTIGVIFSWIFMGVNPVSAGGTVTAYLGNWTTASNPDFWIQGGLDIGVNTQTMTATSAFISLTASGYAPADGLTIVVFGHIERATPEEPMPVQLDGWNSPLRRVRRV
jgi:hypothetical protein